MVNVSLGLCMSDEDDALWQNPMILRRGAPARGMSNNHILNQGPMAHSPAKSLVMSAAKEQQKGKL